MRDKVPAPVLDNNRKTKPDQAFHRIRRSTNSGLNQLKLSGYEYRPRTSEVSAQMFVRRENLPAALMPLLQYLPI